MNKTNFRNHGFSGLKGLEGRVYNSWENMKSRCLNKNNPSFYRYGGRGIKICDEWLKFENFFKDMGHCPSLKHTLNRIDNDGNYSKDNCRWDTHLVQNRNNSHNIRITLKNETKCLSEWCEIKKLNINTIYHRIHRLGHKPEEAITMIKIPNKQIILNIIIKNSNKDGITINEIFNLFKKNSEYSSLTKSGIINNLNKLLKEDKITREKYKKGDLYKIKQYGLQCLHYQQSRFLQQSDFRRN